MLSDVNESRIGLTASYQNYDSTRPSAVHRTWFEMQGLFGWLLTMKFLAMTNTAFPNSDETDRRR